MVGDSALPGLEVAVGAGEPILRGIAVRSYSGSGWGVDEGYPNGASMYILIIILYR